MKASSLLGSIRRALMSDATPFEFREPGLLVDGELTLALMDTVPGNIDRGRAPVYRFTMMRSGTSLQLGEVDLRISEIDDILNYFGHIGYSVLPEYRGHRYAARSCRLLFDLAREHQMKHLWITCNPENLASRRTCILIGGHLINTVELPKNHELYFRGDRHKCRYRIDL